MKMHWPAVVGYQNSQGSNGLQFQKVKELRLQFVDNIVEDFCKLNDCNFGRKFAATIHSFWKVPKLPIFVFEHGTYMACLSVTLVCREVTGLNLACLTAMTM